MTNEARHTPWGAVAAVGLVALIAGGGAGYFLRGRTEPATSSGPRPAPAATVPGPATLTVPADVAAKAGIQIGTAASAAPSRTLRVPGHVEASTYWQVVVTATAPGRITAMTAELGAAVTRGQVLGQIFAPEVADEQRVLLTMRAELEAAHAKLLRTERLVALGSVSQQELEAVRSEHTTHATDVEGARAKLILLGVSEDRIDRLTSADQISAIADIVAPRNGIITNRFANVGQNVEVGANLLDVTDLSHVWVIADVFERDLPRVRLGAPVVVTSPGLAGVSWRARTTYIDPQVVPETRTIRVRTEVANPDGRLRLAQYVDVAIDTPQSAAVLVPARAVQTIANRFFVYIPDGDRFVEREIRLGPAADEHVEVTAGLAAGESVVVAGSFFLRAERDRLGLPLPLPMAQAAPPTQAAGPAPATSAVRRFDIAITTNGFEPGRVEIPSGEPVELRFTRRTETTCAKAVQFPALNITRDLPLNAGVIITLPPRDAGTLDFICGMNMLKGTVIVK